MIENEDQDGDNEPGRMIVNSVAWINEDELEDGLCEAPPPPPPARPIAPRPAQEAPIVITPKPRPETFKFGFANIDRFGQPLHRGEVMVVAGGAGVGKSSWLVEVGHTMAKAGANVVLFSPQFLAGQFAKRMGARLGHLLRQQGLEPDDSFIWEVTEAEYHALPWWTDYEPLQTVEELYARIGEGIEANRTTPDVILLDALDELLGDDPAELQRAMRELKAIAREMDVAIVCTLATRSRRELLKNPHVADLEEYEPLARGADRVAYLQRAQLGDFEHPDDSLVYFAMLKNRHGQLVDEVLAFWATGCVFSTDIDKLMATADAIPF